MYNPKPMENLARFKALSCFKNAVGSFVSNCFIDMIAYTKEMGGQFTSTLAGNRTGCLINGHRHSFTIYSTGKIILTNLFFLNDLASLYSFFMSLFVTLIKKGIAHINDEWSSTRKRVYPRNLRVVFLIENCQFSFQILPIRFRDKYHYEYNGVYSVDINRKSLVGLKNFLNQTLKKKYVFKNEIAEKVLRKSFPADLLQFTILRTMSVDEFFEVKSRASRKRNKDNFRDQHISIHIFPNGKIIVTGSQTKEDLNSIFDTMRSLVRYFLAQSPDCLIGQ